MLTVYKIKISEDTNPYITRNIKEVMDFLETDLSEMGVGSKLTVELSYMEEEEFNSLPDWSGP